jgi:hypothetical protein
MATQFTSQKDHIARDGVIRANEPSTFQANASAGRRKRKLNLKSN